MAVDALRDRGLGRQTWLLDDFGARLRRLRMAKGWSLAVLAQCAHVSKQHLSSLERGARSPSTAVAEACDAALGAGGTLAELAAGGVACQVSGLAGWAPDPVGGPADLGTAEGELLLDTYSALFASLRAMGQLGSPELTLPSLHAGAATLSAAAARCSGRLSCDLWLLAARYAEYCGWMAQESGEEPAALAWIEAAVERASRAGDPDMVGYAWERRALMALYRGDAAETVGLARRAAAEPGSSPRVRALVAQREAQGHALAGDHVSCHRALGRARDLFARAPAAYPRGESWGPTSIPDDSRLVDGWCLADLGRPGEAADLLAEQIATIPAAYRNTRTRFTVRQALAHARAGDVDQACDLAWRVLPDVVRANSATIRVDLGDLARTLSRDHRQPSVHALLPDLNAALRRR